MNAIGESRKEASDRKVEILNAKLKTRIGFWNVRTMYDTGKLAQVISEMRRYNIDILGVSESRWTGSGRLTTSTGETVLYSGRDDHQHREGVAIILKKGVEKSLIEWKPVNSRLMKIRLRGKQINTTIIQCYAPTNDSDDTRKDEFYEQLQAVLETTPRHDMRIVMGDLNAKMGNNNTEHDRAMGREGCGVMNENGERLAEFCTMHDLVIGGTLFQHKVIHKLTWHSPNGKDQNQIDHLMINGTWRRSLLDVKVKRGADIGSDHHLVTAVLRIKLKKTGSRKIARKQFDVGKLNDTKVRGYFVLQLKNRFQALADMLDHTEPKSDDINTMWEQTKTTYVKTSEACLGYKHKEKKEWLSDDTWQTVENRRALKKKVNEAKSERLKEKYRKQYQETNKVVRRKARADKRAYLENLASQAEEAARKGEQGKVYKITKIVSGKHRRTTEAPIVDKKGQLLTTESQQEARWAEHFQEVLNRPPPTTEPNIQHAENDLDISIEPPTKEEIVSAIKSQKNGKAPGQDNLNAELFKADPDLASKILQPLFKTIWEGKEIPDDWSEGIIIKIPKKGNLRDCNKWRGITLLSIPSKIMAKIIEQRLTEAVDKKLRNEQAGFRKGRGCIDQIFALRNIIEQCTEWQRQIYINFIDFEKAFDSIHREGLWNILRLYGIPQHIVDLIKTFYANFKCRVGSSSLVFQVKTGVRQGCVMSALLFNIVIDWVMRRTTEDQTRGIRWTLFSALEDLDFADDLALVSHTHQHMQEKTSRLSYFAQQVGLKINQKKSEVMALNISDPLPIHVNGEALLTTNEFTYLGSIVRYDGGAHNDIKNRINKARNAFRMLNNIWKSQQYRNKTKLKLYQSCVLSTLLYGAECWRMTENDIRQLSVFHTRSLRRICRIFWPSKISNKDLLTRCQQDSMANIITKRRWNWIGHVLRREHDSIPRVALHWTPEGRRKRGRPKITWRRTVEEEIKSMNLTWGDIQKKAQNRPEWRTFVAALHARGIMGSK